MNREYDVKTVEERWQRRWAERRIDEVQEDPSRPKYYCLEMLPYPSGRAHMGHVRNYSIGDVMARFQRMRGRNVLHPIGWDSFGLPAENAAIDHGAQPLAWTEENIERMQQQFRRLGLSYAWDREVAAHRPEYYRWNQWMFLKMLERDLAYRSRRAVNWCDRCATVLANEQVESGNCWRCGEPVRTRDLEQWFLRITRYAEDLVAALEGMTGWPEKVLSMQRNWIGRSVGTEVSFEVLDPRMSLSVFTTRIDTIFGCTFLVMAPDHPRLPELLADATARREVERFREEQAARSTAEEVQATVEKSGVFTGRHALNPFSGEPVPIWVANFVLADYGTGALMAVPAHDERDHEFALKYDLPIRQVIEPASGTCDVATEAFTEEGLLVASGAFTGLESAAARERMTRHAAAAGFGEARVMYRIKDWGISRQRYWGTPIPIIHCGGCGAVPVPEEDLPVLLPADIRITGKGGSPLAEAEEFVRAACPRCGAEGRRETDTMDTFIDSSWYYFRYCDPGNDRRPYGDAADYWVPVDLYVGGIEHAVTHLIYTRFFTRVMHDLGLTAAQEPILRQLSQGMVIDWSYRCPRHGYLSPERRAGDWRADPTSARCGECGEPVEVRKEKMSKSKFNTVDPDYLLERFGADTTRLFALFAAPPEKDMEWSDSGIEGCDRFLARVRRTVDRLGGGGPATPPDGGYDATARELRRKTHETIQRVTQDIEERIRLNTAVAAIMELANAVHAAAAAHPAGEPLPPGGGLAHAVDEALGVLALLLFPFAPHLASEAWERLGRGGEASDQTWPEADPALLTQSTVNLVIQVNGKVRGRVEVPAGAGEAEAVEAARGEPRVAAHLEGKTLRRAVYVPGRILNLVVG
ncbi:MAG: leucine--tRNA ligase [Acidobacteriota bacterium]|jgi:leucyl-tRNA synthetase